MERKKTAASFSDVAKKTPLRKPKVGWLNKLGGEGGWVVRWQVYGMNLFNCSI